MAPGMFARVTLIPPAGPRVALIPTDALVSTGSDSRVIVQRHDGSFAPVPEHSPGAAPAARRKSFPVWPKATGW